MADFTDDILLSAGSNVEVMGDVLNAILVSNGSNITESGIKAEDILVSNGSSVNVHPFIQAIVSNGSNITIDDYRPQSQFIMTGKGVKQVAINDFHMYCLRGEHNVRVDVKTPPEEPPVIAVSVTRQSGTSVDLPQSGYPYFYVNPNDYGQTVLSVTGGVDDVNAFLTVDVVDRNPDDPLVTNGSQVNIIASPWIPDKGGISNNNTNNVNATGYASFAESILIQNGSRVNAGQYESVWVSNGSNTTAGGFSPDKADLRVRNGSRINVIGGVYFIGGDILVKGGSRVEVTDGHEVHVVHGVNIAVEGIGGIPSGSVLSKNGSRVDTGKGYIIVRSKDERVVNGSSVNMFGVQPGDILVSHHADSHVFRGVQVEESDIIVTNGSTVVLTGVAIGGTISDVGVPCEIFIASMKNDYQFVRGQITEIPEISLDSSIKLGVKLYSCDNTLLNVSTFTSAYFTFDDELQLPANIDPVSNLIYVLANPSDLGVLKRNKVYDMRVHVTDKSGNTSIVLIRKLRFV